MYESGMGAMIEVAVRLEDYLKQPMVIPVDILDYRHSESVPMPPDLASMDNFTRQVFVRLKEMGFSVPTAKCPFEALTKDHEVLILTGVGHKETRLIEKAKVVSDLGKIDGDTLGHLHRKGEVKVKHRGHSSNQGGTSSRSWTRRPSSSTWSSRKR